MPKYPQENTRPKYALVTAAYNEENYIRSLIDSIVAQTQKPECWVIVSDGSTDRTDSIVSAYSTRYPFIVLHRISEDHPRNFTAQVNAINTGIGILQQKSFDFLGNLDADVTLPPNYFADLLARFRLDPDLGLAGGWIYELRRNTFRPRSGNSRLSVAHAVQLFRRDCLADIGGGYKAMPYGGPDWHAEVSARFCGWKVEAFPELEVKHHRPTGSAAGLLRTSYREGLMDYSFGSSPLFELFRIARRLRQKPLIIGALIRLWSFVIASLRNRERPVPTEFVRFLRSVELSRLKRIISFRAVG